MQQIRDEQEICWPGLNTGMESKEKEKTKTSGT